nr:UDP-glycosyltransferase [Paris polyphylla]
MEAQRETVTHVLVFPFPIQGHVASMLKLAELLSLARIHVTFLNTDGNHQRLRSFSGSYARLDQRTSFYFRSIPDGLPEDHPRSGGSQVFDLVHSLRARSMAPFRELLIAGGSEGRPPITCAVVDALMNFAVETAEAAGIPTVAFRTISACSFWAYACIPNLIQSGEIPLPEGANMDEPIQNIPGMEHFLRRRDLPSFLRQVKDITDPNFQFLADATSDTSRARGTHPQHPRILGGISARPNQNPLPHHIRPRAPSLPPHNSRLHLRC